MGYETGEPLRLIVESGPLAGQEFLLRKTEVTLGRGKESDVAIPDPTVSRQHAVIRKRGLSWAIEDLESTSGTFVNGQRLVGPQQLSHGDTVRLGSTTLRLAKRVEESRIPTALPAPQGGVRPRTRGGSSPGCDSSPQ